jgi:hypothetical protein
MKKTILAASAAILAIGGAAYAAQPAGGFDPNADMTMADAKAKSDEMFARMDVNGDGKIDKADREAKQAERFAAKDTNGDGVLSEEEFAARGERGDGERSGHKGHRGGKRGGGMAMMKMADTNGDQAVTKAEFDAAFTKHFTMMDTDKNGTVTAEDRKAARDKMRTMMRGAGAAR